MAKEFNKKFMHPTGAAFWWQNRSFGIGRYNG